MDDFMAKLQAAADPKFNSRVMPRAIRLFRSTAAYAARTAFENGNSDWKKLFAAQPDSPETLISVELLTEIS